MYDTNIIVIFFYGWRGNDFYLSRSNSILRMLKSIDIYLLCINTLIESSSLSFPQFFSSIFSTIDIYSFFVMHYGEICHLDARLSTQIFTRLTFIILYKMEKVTFSLSPRFSAFISISVTLLIH